jgi:hypothetical protein
MRQTFGMLRRFWHHRPYGKARDQPRYSFIERARARLASCYEFPERLSLGMLRAHGQVKPPSAAAAATAI